MRSIDHARTRTRVSDGTDTGAGPGGRRDGESGTGRTGDGGGVDCVGDGATVASDGGDGGRTDVPGDGGGEGTDGGDGRSDGGGGGDGGGGDGGGDGGRFVVALVSGSHFVNHTYLVLLPPLLPALRADLGATAAAVGLGVGVQAAVNAATQLPFGRLSDARGRDIVLLASLALGALGAALTALAPTVEWLLAAQVVLGVGTGGHHPAHYPMLAAATDPDRRARAYSAHGFAGALGFAAPPAAVGAVLALGGGWRLAVGLVAAVGAAYAALAALALRRVDPAVRKPPAARRAGRGERPGEKAGQRRPSAEDGAVRGAPTALARLRSGLSAAVEGVVRTLSAPALVTLAVLALVTAAAAWGVRTYALVLLTDGYGVGPDAANVAVAAMFVVGACLVLVGGALTDRVSPGAVLAAGFAGLVVLAAGLAAGAAPHPGGTPAVPAAVGVGLTLLLSGTVTLSRPARFTLTDALSSEDDLGTSFGLVTVGITGGGAVAPPVFGYVVDTAGVAPVFYAVAALAGLALALSALLVRVARGRTVTGRQDPAVGDESGDGTGDDAPDASDAPDAPDAPDASDAPDAGD